jgi:hypothetical protein
MSSIQVKCAKISYTDRFIPGKIKERYTNEYGWSCCRVAKTLEVLPQCGEPMFES